LEQKIPYRLVAFDLDNTTLYRGAMSNATKHALMELKSRGVITVAATGRHISLIPSLIRKNRNIDYLICVTGSSIYQVETRKTTYLWQMTSMQARLAVEACKGLGARLNLVTRKLALAEKAAFRSFVKSPAVNGQSRGKHSIKQVLRLVKMMLVSSLMDDAASYLDRHANAIVEKIDAFFDDDRETTDAVRLLQELGCFEVAESPRYLEITAKGCNKGNALARLCEWLGLTRHDVIAFGDSGNDLSMVDHVSMFVAMGNAEPAVLQCAGRIAPDVREDGFAAVVAEVFSV